MHTNSSDVSSLPSIAEQADTLAPLLQRTVQESNAGTVWGVVSSKWMKSVRRYLGLDPSRTGSDKKPTYPACMDSTGLHKSAGDGYGYSGRPVELRKDIEIGNQIEVVCDEAYELLRKWYGVGHWHKDIKRAVIETKNADGETVTELELWPVIFPLCECAIDGEPREKRKKAITVSRTLDCASLISLAIKEFDIIKVDSITEDDDAEKNCRVWYSSDGDVWTIIGDRKGVAEGTPTLVSELPKLLSSPKRSLMVETAQNGRWLRSGVDMVKVVSDMTAKLHAVDKMTDEEWREALSVGDFCDHLDPGTPATETTEATPKKWREAEVIAVEVLDPDTNVSDHDHDTKGDRLTLSWRGHPNHRVIVHRNDASLAKPYSKARDWRNQLRTNTKVEVRLDALTASEGEEQSKTSPVYKMGSYFFYYHPGKAEWWIGDTVRYRHGYLNADCGEEIDKILNPLDIPSKAWSYYNPQNYRRCWEVDDCITVTEKVPGPNSGDFPEAIEIAGHTGYQKDKMGVYTRTHFIMADVHRIDRKQGKLEVIVKKERGYQDTHAKDIVKGIRLYSGQVCEPGTHLTIRKRKANWTTENIEADGDDREGKRRGCVGLRNLGNTCFMNSMLQCLNAAVGLQEYFVSKQYEHEINTKNALGTGGVLAQSYGALVEDMWAGTFRLVAPTDFKDTLGRFAPQFAGYQQQDSMELFSYLLDNLHEDLNRIIKKPYVEDIDDDKKLSDVAMAEEKWRRYKLRNDSVIVDQMMGQFRSHLTCPNEACRHESRKFDEYSSVALPLPQKASKQLAVSVVYLDFARPALNITVTVSKKGRVTEVVSEACRLVDGLTMANVMLVELVQGKIYRTYYSPAFGAKDIDTLDGIADNDLLVLYEIPGTLGSKSDVVLVDDDSSDDEDGGGMVASAGYSNRFNYSQLGGMSNRLRTAQAGVYPGADFDGMVVQVQQMMRDAGARYTSNLYEHMGPPRLLVFDKEVSCKVIHETIWKWVAHASQGVYTLDDVPSRFRVFDSHRTEEAEKDSTTPPEDSATPPEDSATPPDSSPSPTFSVDSQEMQATSTSVAEEEPAANEASQAPMGELSEELELIHQGTHESENVGGQRTAALATPPGDTTANATAADTGDVSTTEPNASVTEEAQSSVPATDTNPTAGSPTDDNATDANPTAGSPTDDNATDQNTTDATAKGASENDENQRNKQAAAATDDVAHAEPPPPPAYTVMLADEYSLLRRDTYSDKMVYLPYTDATFQSVRDTHITHSTYNNRPVHCCVVFERDCALFQSPANADNATASTTSTTMLASGTNRRNLALSKSLVQEETFVDPTGDDNDDKSLTLSKCLEAFSVREQLGKMDTWYCPKCKDHVQAFKKMDLWSVPPILTLHLKRFQYETGYFREKLDVPVKFDEFIDMREFVLGPQREEDLTYELFAVSNHIGFGIGGGHYTAYAKHGHKWILFNDGTFSDAEAKDVCTEEAYVLFYRRRSLYVGAEDESDESDDVDRGGGGGGRGGSDDGADVEVTDATTTTATNTTTDVNGATDDTTTDVNGTTDDTADVNGAADDDTADVNVATDDTTTDTAVVDSNTDVNVGVNPESIEPEEAAKSSDQTVGADCNETDAPSAASTSDDGIDVDMPTAAL